MHTIKITPNLLFEYQCTSGKFIRLQIENNRFGNKNLIESNRNFFCPNWNGLPCSRFASTRAQVADITYRSSIEIRRRRGCGSGQRHAL